jgi:hypothetical protein
MCGFGKGFGLSSSIATVLWCSSPMILGHGWAVMPDALSAVAMVVLLATSLRWLEFPHRSTYWLYLYQRSARRLNWVSAVRLFKGHLGHGVIALIVVIVLVARVMV